MLFLTYWFVLFLCISLPTYWFIRYPPARLAVLLVSCVVFHTHFAGPAGVLPIVILGVISYLSGLSRNRFACLGAILLCVASLVFYKYTEFLCLQIIAPFWKDGGSHGYTYLAAYLPEFPPLAISFFVFEFVHYLFDVRRGSEPIRSPWDFSLFAIFWPSIVAGPVKRYRQFLPSLYEAVHGVCRRDVAVGLLQLSVGLVKKFVADMLTAMVKFYGPYFENLPPHQRWLIFMAIGLRILLDFSGYSDMAIGLARMFGVRLPTNFNWPYLAGNLTEFWHRWHISLSTWIRDYVYIPIGGSRAGLVRKVFNVLVAFGLCGLWHGAAWNFLVWGVYHGAGLAICSSYKSVLGRAGERLAAWFAVNRSAGWLLTMLFVHAGWLLFFYPVPQALKMLWLLLP